MKRISFLVLSVAICGTAIARPTYDFKQGWDTQENNDQNHPTTNQPYTQAQIRAFLEDKKDRDAVEDGARILGRCGKVEIQKGCHQASDRHVTIRADERENSNQTNACVEVNTNRGIHVNGC